jgi:V8-like Glu-specific endopeptidase
MTIQSNESLVHWEPSPTPTSPQTTMAFHRLAAGYLLAGALCAQAAPEESSTHFINIDSGLVRNQTSTPAAIGLPQVVWSKVVTVPTASWLRLEYEGVLLSGSAEPGFDGSFLRLTSMLDGAVQTQHLRHIGEWKDTSAYFNGDSVLVELLAQPNTGDNRLVIRNAIAGPSQPIGIDTICGPTDDRTLSNDLRVARNQPTGCTSWMINDCAHCFLTAGHCAGSGLQVVEFNVPLSTSTGSIQHPGPQDQYAVDTGSLQSNGGLGVGDDWAYFGVFNNSTTGLSPYDANGMVAFDLQPTPPAVSGQNIRITGNGSTTSPVSPTWYLVQKTHAGPYSSFSGTTVRYTTDTTGGNSGSPVILDGTNQAIGIHTHGGCSSTGGSNASTGSNHPALQAALANPQGICDCPELDFTFPNGLPQFIAPDGSTTVRVTTSGPIPLVAGSVRLNVSTGGAYQQVVPTTVNANTFDCTFPISTCGVSVSFYFSAQGTNTTTYTSPDNAPTTTYSRISAQSLSVIRNYNFNTNPAGWSVVNTALATGPWERGTPADSRGPSADFDGSGQCWVTGNQNNVDVDGGPTELITETIDLSSSNAPTASYAVWFTSTGSDVLTISASNDGGANWTQVEVISSTQGWEQRNLDIANLFPTPNQFVLRYSTEDQPNDSVTEAALDAFRIEDAACTVATWNTYGAGCSNGSSAPSLQLLSLPDLGTTFIVRALNLSGSPTAMIVGLASENTPITLSNFATGCDLLARPDVIQVMPSLAIYILPIPSNPIFSGTQIHLQAVEFGALWTVSEGGVGEIQ